MKVLITGGAGFLGSHLCDRFIKEGYHVVCMDNLITGSLRNIDHLFGNDQFTYVKHDVTNFIHVTGQLDLVLHFASPASPIDYLEMPIKTLKVGSLGTHKALGLARAKNARFLLASTSEVYGDPAKHPQKESYWGNVNPIGFRGVYDEAKRFAEAMTMAYHRYHGMATNIVRIFNTYGSRMRIEDGRALPTFMAQALQGEKLTVYGDGSQTRSFMFIDDLVEGIWRLSQTDYAEPVNIGNPQETSILEFAREIIDLTDSNSDISFEELPKDDPKVRQPDITTAQKVLDWKPVVQRINGLKKSMGYFKKQIKQLEENK